MCSHPWRCFSRLMFAVVDSVAASVNASWNPAVAMSDLVAAGARRISVGPQAHLHTLAALDVFARPLLETLNRAG